MKVLVTGAAGFIGSNFVEYYIRTHSEDSIIVLDKLTYAGNIHNLDLVKNSVGMDEVFENDFSDNYLFNSVLKEKAKNFLEGKSKVLFIQGDICDEKLVSEIFDELKPDAVVHFAAESHVDNSIKHPFVFTKTNVLGTHTLLEIAHQSWGEGDANEAIKSENKSNHKFVHISTDEVFGALPDLPDELAREIAKNPKKVLEEMDGNARETWYFTETRQIQPNSPYSASKAGSDMIARAYFGTFKMNVNVTNCSNNYGPYQHKEKLIPNTINLALKGEKIPVYGTGRNIRDWLYVEDHCKAIDKVLHNANPGERYCIGGHNEKRNIDIVKLILKHLYEQNVLPNVTMENTPVFDPEKLIEFVADRKGHDFRYAIDPTKISMDLDWEPETRFEDGIVKTIDWYLNHREWLG